MKKSGIVTKSILAADYSNPNEIVAAVNGVWECRSAMKFNLERQWFQNIAWYMGLQNLVWSNSAERLTEPRAPSWRVRMIVNHLQGMVRTIGAKLYKSAPEWDVLPATTDAIDLQVAQIGNQLLQANWYRMLMDEKVFEALLWALTTGNGFIEHTWDPDAGEPVYYPSEEGGVEQEDLSVGETAVEVVPPFEMITDPNVTNFRDSPWAIRSKPMNYDLLCEQFPRAEAIKNFTSESPRVHTKFQEHLKTLTSRGPMANTRGDSSSINKDTVIVHHLWVRPRRQSRTGLKRGKLVIIAGDTILNGNGKGVDFPYLHGELPFAHIIEVPVPGRLWGTCTLEQLLPLQGNYNRTRSQLIENRNLMSRPKWLVPRGSGVSADALTSEPGELVDHNPGLPPTALEPPNIPPYVQNMLTTDKLDMEDIAGIHEVSRGEAPGQIRSGSGVDALVEKDETRQGPVVRHIEAQLARLGRQNLAVSAQFVTEQRLAKIVGGNDELLLFNYSGNQLIGSNASLPGVSYFDVRVRTTSGLPNSRSGQQQLLGQLVEIGALQPQTNETDRRAIFKLLSIGRTIDSLDEARVHRSRQLQEIERIINGEDVRAEQWHNHRVHLEVLDDFRNSARYDILDPQIKAKLQAHSQSHKEWIAYNAIEPQILTRKAAMLAMVREQMGQVGAAASSEASNMLGGSGGGGSAPLPAEASQPQGVSSGQG